MQSFKRLGSFVYLSILIAISIVICNAEEEEVTTMSSITSTAKHDFAKREDHEKHHIDKLQVVEVESTGKLQLPQGYHKAYVPESVHGPEHPLKVCVFIAIRSITSIDSKNEKISLDLDMHTFWSDDRFQTNHSDNIVDSAHHTKRIEVQKLHPEFAELLWQPDIIIENAITTSRTDQSNEPILIFNSETGFVKYSRLEITIPCQMNFFYFPLDVQYCPVNLRSYQHHSSKMELKWVSHGAHLEISANPNFYIKLNGTTADKRSLKAVYFPNLNFNEKLTKKTVVWEKNTLDVLTFVIGIRRNISFHLAQTYLPSFFFVLITWLCFLLPASMSASRVGITMTTILTINTMFNSVRDHSPQVSYAKAIDVWMVFSVFFAFLSLVKFTIISWLDFVKEREEKLEKDAEEEAKEGTEPRKESYAVLCTDSPITDKLGSRGTYHVRIPPKKSSASKMMNPFKLSILLRTRKVLKKRGFAIICASYMFFNFVYWGWLCFFSGYFHWSVDPVYNA